MKKKTIVFLCTLILACGISVSAHALPYSGDHNWYVDGDAIWTAWSGQWVEYHVPSSDWEANFGFVSVSVSANNTYKVKYTWLNDTYSPPHDANILIASVFFDDTANNTSPIPNPEPTTMLLVGTGIVGLAGFRKKFKR